jgi:hypothetical protein
METTQATAPAPAQVQQPVHPIHQETATLNALTQWVSGTEDNDPHAGTDLEAPQKQQTAPEVPVEQPKEAAAPEQEQIELPEDEPLFEIEYKTDNGKEQKKLSLKELREGYLAKQDYHRNIQKVKAEQAEIAQKVQQAQLQAQQEYVQRIELHKQAVQKLAGVKTMQEIETLSREDPAAAQQEFLRLISVNQTMTALEAERQQAMAQHQQALQAAQHQAITKARETLEAEIPGWNADLYNNVLGTVAKEYGFKNEEVAPVVDARLIKVFHDAAKYRQLQQAKPEVSKRVVAIPKVVKPGSAEKPNPAREAVDELSARLKKTGRGEDFVALYLAKQKQQKGK